MQVLTATAHRKSPPREVREAVRAHTRGTAEDPDTNTS